MKIVIYIRVHWGTGIQPPRLIWIDSVSCSFVVDLTFSGQPSSFLNPPPCCSFMASSDVIGRFFCPYMAKLGAPVYRVLCIFFFCSLFSFKASCRLLIVVFYVYLLMFASRFARSQGLSCPLCGTFQGLGNSGLLGLSWLLSFLWSLVNSLLLCIPGWC